jgi:hypothetical protein
MNTGVLVRAPLVTLEDSLRSELVELSEKARAVLGYVGLSNALSAQKQNEAGTQFAADVFARLGIEPFTNESVERYKAKMLHKLNKPYRLDELCDHGGFAASYIISGVALLIFSLACLFIGIDAGWHKVPLVVKTLAVASTIIPAWAISVGVRAKRIQWEWRSVPLHQTNSHIPAFAISRAIELRQELGANVNLGIEELRSWERTKDPFLFADIAGKRYYLDVWDEPGFEGRRTV